MPATYTDSIDGLTTSVAEKAPVVVATNGAITLSGEQTVNGIACVEGDRVLVKDQDDSTTNGIYVCSDSAWSRALDFNGNRDVVKGTSVRVAGPSVSTGSLYIVTTENPIVIGTSAIVFVQKPEGTSESTLFVSMEDLRVSTTDQDYIETTSFYAGGTTGGAKLYRDGTGTPTGLGAAVIAAALAAGTFCNAAGNCYKLRTDQTINAFQFGATADATTDDRLFLQAAIDFCELTAAELTMYPGVYRITQYIEITAAMSMVAAGIAGPRVYASAAGIYGGPEIFLDASPADRTLKAAYCLSIDAGAVGAEGYARVRVEGIGFSWNGLAAGGVYVEGAADVAIDDNWFSGGLTNYNLGTQTGFCIYTRDAIQTKITRNNFRYAAYGVVGEEYVNEVVIHENNFDKLVETAVLIRGSTSGIRSAVTNNNIIDTKYGVVVVGNASSVTIDKNTFEIIRYIPVYVTNTDPISSAVVAVPRDVHTLRNAFIACNISVVGPLIQYIACVGGQIGGNESRSPTGNTNYMLNIGAPCSEIELQSNDNGALTLFSGSYEAVVPSVPLEITFTPVVDFGGASVGATYSVQVGKAVKIGKKVHVQGQVALTAKGSSTGTMSIGGFPIASKNTTNLATSFSLNMSNFTGVSGHIQAYMLPNTSKFSLNYLGTGAQSNLGDTHATNTSAVIFSGVYESA